MKTWRVTHRVYTKGIKKPQRRTATIMAIDRNSAAGKAWTKNKKGIRNVDFGDIVSITEQKQSLSPRKSGSGPTNVRSHARRGTKGVRAHTRKR